MASPVRMLTVLSLLLSASASRADDPRCTIPGADGWREYRSAHFVLSTDVPRGRVPALVQQLEELHALVVASIFGEAVAVPGRAHVVAFSSRRPYEELAPAHAAAYAPAGQGERWIVFAWDGHEPGPAVAHELAHALSWHQFPRQPPWFREGLAQFVETVGHTRDEARAVQLGSLLVRDRWSGGRWAGFASPELVERARSAGAPSAKELLEWRGRVDERDPGRFHAGSWLLYHWLANEHARRLTAYEDRLEKGDDPATAWRATFPEYDPARPEAMARLDRELASYRRDARYLAFRVRTGKVDASFAERAIPTAELHVLLLGLRHPSRWPGSIAERTTLMRAEYDEALREDPTLPRAVVARARDEGTSVADALSAVTAARPSDPWAWFLLASALDPAVDPREKEAALRKAVSLAPDDARMNDALASLLVASGRAKEARPFADRALDLAPSDPEAIDTLASVAYAIGQCDPALTLQQRAADLFAADDPAGAGVRRRLAQYDAKCGAALVPASASASAR